MTITKDEALRTLQALTEAGMLSVVIKRDGKDGKAPLVICCNVLGVNPNGDMFDLWIDETVESLGAYK